MKAPVVVFEILWILFLNSYCYNNKNYGINICFAQPPSQSAVYIFKKTLRAKESWFGGQETVDGTVYTTVYTF